MKPSYLNLCTEFYDLTKPEAGPKEVAFYAKILGTSKGPILEGMCGSGRLLIPLLKCGLVIEGVDNSNYMLQSCRKRCSDQNLSVQLYHQTLQQLDLPRKYDIIFIAIGSFQLIQDRNEAFNVLKNLYLALLPGGRIVLETFIPWGGIKDNIHDSVLINKSKEMLFERTVTVAGSFQIIHKSKVILYFKEQIQKTQSRYEKWIQTKLSQAEEEDYEVRWYHRYEMEFLLEKVGFSNVRIIDESFEQNEQAVIYLASKMGGGK